ncbi:MAG: imidazoleglycerol-phosphate dehydratase HisB [Eubacterium sp.]|nr:imidazoleglycerol-phosphate dehydratase HisB [Eubacterium sp.]
MGRSACCKRETKETQIKINLEIDGTGKYNIHTGIGFFDHMLEGFARHGLFDLDIQVHGDVEVDAHHTVEDTGIVLGQAFKEALGNKEGIARFGSFVLPMDDALVLASLDISGRTYFAFDAELPAERLGTMETETVREFFMGFASGVGMNLHIRQIAGNNTHHIVEAMFKAVAKAMDQAVRVDERIQGVLSTKGTL